MMAVAFLDAMAQAIYYYEGHQPHDRNHLNNNPGNLRPTEGSDLPVDDGGYLVFPSFMRGYLALVADIQAKITGHNTHGLNLDSNLEDFFRVYAPSSDRNQPVIYARFVADWLSRTYGQVLYPVSTFREMLIIIAQQVD